MVHKVKRFTFLIVSIVMVLSMLISCSATPGTTTTGTTTATTAGTTAVTEPTVDLSLPIVKDKLELTAFWPAPANVLKFITDFNEASIYPVLEEQTNIHIKWQHGNVEQFQLMINSGDLADIMFAPDASYMYPGGGDKGIADGIYLKLNDYLDQYGLNYKKLIESTPDFKRDSRTDAGNIYGFSMVETLIQGAWMGMTVRKDWVEKLGLAMPETYDDWYEMLKKFKTELNATSPLLLPKELFDWCDSFISGYNVGKGFYQVDRVVKYGPLEPGFEQFITMLAKWYKEDLIDKDFATRDNDSLNQLKYTKQAGAWFDGFWMLNFNKTHAEDSSDYQQYAVANPVQNKGDIAHLRQVNYNIRNEWTMVSAKSEHKVEAVRWLDNLYSEENYILTNYGVEGEGYTKQGDEYILSDLITKNPDGLVMAEALFRYAMHDGPMWRIWDREKPGWTEDEIACEPIWNKADATYTIPMISLTAEEATENSAVMSDINTFVTESCTRFVMGLDDIATFDAFVAKIKTMGIDKAIEIQQAAVDRYYKR